MTTRQYHDTERTGLGWGNGYLVTCANPDCGKQFEAKRYDASFCSSTCRSQYRRAGQKRQQVRDNALAAVAALIDQMTFERPSKDSYTVDKLIKQLMSAAAQVESGDQLSFLK